MRCLIYTVAIGDEYRGLAGLLVRSLRINGYRGEVAVLAENPLPGPCDTIVVDRAELVRLQMCGSDALYLRTVADQFIPDFFNHDYLLHLDADVLCVGNIDELLAGLASRSVVAVQKYDRPLSALGQNFTSHDWSRVRGHPFAACGGMVGFRGGLAGRDFLRLWAFEAAARRFDDQTALNVVLHRGLGGRFEFIPRAVFWPQADPSSLIHFLGYRALMPGVFEERYGP
jgi:hypothetical protein